MTYTGAHEMNYLTAIGQQVDRAAESSNKSQGARRANRRAPASSLVCCRFFCAGITVPHHRDQPRRW